mgnify:CR=1 FL=1
MTRILVADDNRQLVEMLRAMLEDAGYDVVGITMRLYSGDETGAVAHGTGSCCGLEGVEDARAICQTLGVPFYPLNFERQFEQHVIAPFAAEYAAGRTPTPCRWPSATRTGSA